MALKNVFCQNDEWNIELKLPSEKNSQQNPFNRKTYILKELWCHLPAKPKLGGLLFCTKKNTQKRKERILNNIISGLLNSMVWKENEESGWCTNLCTLVKLKVTSSEIRTFLESNYISGRWSHWMMWQTKNHHRQADRSSLDKFDSFWTNLINFEPIYPTLIHFDPIWSSLNKFEQVWTSLNQFSPFGSNLDPIWSSLIKLDHVSSSLIKFDQVWSSLNNMFQNS